MARRLILVALALVMSSAGLVRASQQPTPWGVAMTPFSAKLVCQQAHGSALRHAGPWRIPDKWIQMWGADFPYEFNGGPTGDNCALLMGPKAAVARATTTTAPPQSGSTPLKAYVECWASTVRPAPDPARETIWAPGSMFRRYPVPSSGVLVARFQIGPGDLCRVSAGGGDKPWPWATFPGPIYSSGGASESPPNHVVASDKFHCLPMGDRTTPCVFRIRTTPHTRSRLAWSPVFTGRLRLSERSGSWTSVRECDVANGVELRCTVVSSPGRRPSGGITIVAGEPIAWVYGTWMVGADSRPIWPA